MNTKYRYSIFIYSLNKILEVLPDLLGGIAEYWANIFYININARSERLWTVLVFDYPPLSISWTLYWKHSDADKLPGTKVGPETNLSGHLSTSVTVRQVRVQASKQCNLVRPVTRFGRQHKVCCQCPCRDWHGSWCRNDVINVLNLYYLITAAIVPFAITV